MRKLTLLMFFCCLAFFMFSCGGSDEYDSEMSYESPYLGEEIISDNDNSHTSDDYESPNEIPEELTEVPITRIPTIVPAGVSTFTVTLAWDPNMEEDLAGYKIYYKADSSDLPFDGTYALSGSSPIDVGNVTEATITLPAIPNTIHYFAATAYNTAGYESSFSNIVATDTTLTDVVSVYRFWSDQNQSHFFTSSEAERDSIIKSYPTYIWKYEGIAFYAFSSQQLGTVPIHRFWSDQNQSHFYTASEAEKNHIIANYPRNVWQYESKAFYAYNKSTYESIPIFRFWSDQNQTHFYTASESEKNHIIANYPSNVWRYEGIAFHVPKN